MVVQMDGLIQRSLLIGLVVLVGATYYLQRKNEGEEDGDSAKKEEFKSKIVVVFSGKRKSGKDYITDRLLERIQTLSNDKDICEIGRLSAPLKKAYAVEHNLDYEQLLSDGPYKENYRADMIKWGELKRDADPSFFARLVMKDATSPIVIISDARRKTDLQFFRSKLPNRTSSACIAVRVEASSEARSSRGYKFTPGVDDVDSECGLDNVKTWNFVIRNDAGDPNSKASENSLSESIDKLARRVLQRLSESKSSVRIPSKVSGAKTEKKSSTPASSQSQSSEMRGYKLTADGRKTTFFNNDLDDEAKALIGDIRPKKLDESTAAQDAAAKVAAGSSVWNTAGTWEERGMTEWGKEKLTALFKGGLEFNIPNGGGKVKTSDLKDLTGDCSITMIRRKKKHLFDWSFKLDWSVQLKDAGYCSGSLTFPDVTPDCDGEYEATMVVNSNTPPQARALLNNFVNSSSTGLRPIVSEKINEFMEEFNKIE